jgi:hypothetical protein
VTKSIAVRLYGHPGNNAIVKIPDRKNPGVVIQADTLHSLVTEARQIANNLHTRQDIGAIAEEADALASRLEEILEKLKGEVSEAGEQISI